MLHRAAAGSAEPSELADLLCQLALSRAVVPPQLQRDLRAALLAGLPRMSGPELGASLLCYSRLGWPAGDDEWLEVQLEAAFEGQLIRALPAMAPAAACYAASALTNLCSTPAAPELLAALRPKLLQLLQQAGASPGAVAQGVWTWRRLGAPVDGQLGGALDAALSLALPAMNERQLGLICQAFLLPARLLGQPASDGGDEPGEAAEVLALECASYSELYA